MAKKKIPKNIFLIGLMGSGKTRVGRIISQRAAGDVRERHVERRRDGKNLVPIVC